MILYNLRYKSRRGGDGTKPEKGQTLSGYRINVKLVTLRKIQGYLNASQLLCVSVPKRGAEQITALIILQREDKYDTLNRFSWRSGLYVLRLR